MGYLIDILIGAASRIVTGELSAHVEPVARWVIDRAVERLPADNRDKFREEWLAHLNEMPGVFRKLSHAVGCRVGASAITNVLRQRLTEETATIHSTVPAGGLAPIDKRHHRKFMALLFESGMKVDDVVMTTLSILPWDDMTAEHLQKIVSAMIDAVNGTLTGDVTIKIRDCVVQMSGPGTTDAAVEATRPFVMRLTCQYPAHRS